MNESNHSNYLKLQMLTEKNSELELSGNKTRISNTMDRTRLEQDMLVIEKKLSAENIAKVA